MLKKISLITSLIFVSIFSMFAAEEASIQPANKGAQEENTSNVENPVAMLNSTIVKTQDELVQNSNKYKNDPYALLKLINTNILPLIDTNVVAQLVVGTDKWKAATPAEQQEFIKSATEMLVFMYAKNVAYAGKYEIVLFPFNNKNWQTKPVIIVNGKVVNTNNNQSSDFSVKMFKKNNQWKVYDFSVAGISVLETYKQQFARYKSVADMNVAIKKTTDKLKFKYYPDLLDNETREKLANEANNK